MIKGISGVNVFDFTDPIPDIHHRMFENSTRIYDSSQTIYWCVRYICEPYSSNATRISVTLARFTLEPFRSPLRSLVASLHMLVKLMVRWVVGSILHGVDPLSYFSFQPFLHDWYIKGRRMCYPVCGVVHIKEPLLLIGRSSLCGGSGFPFSLSEWSLTICLMPYNRK